ncbi:MAG: acyl-CoA dehydrogenase, partial [Pseudomonadota bacterium]
EILKVTAKSGGSGRLVFVTVTYRILQAGRICIREEQDIVYREPAAAMVAPTPLQTLQEIPPGSWSQAVIPDPVLLFRFSALTFNAHRIHYDRPYAINEEGYPGLVVHGPLTAIMLMDLVRCNASRELQGFSFRGRAPLFDLHPFRLVGTASETGVDLQAQGPDGKTTMTARAEFV